MLKLGRSEGIAMLGIVMPNGKKDKYLVSLLLILPAGLTQAPLTFCTTTETAVDQPIHILDDGTQLHPLEVSVSHKPDAIDDRMIL